MEQMVIDEPVPSATTQPKSAAAMVPVGARGVMLQSLDDLWRFARMAVEGGVAPKGMSPGAAAMAIQAGLERGLGPLGGLQACIVINGVLSWRGQAAAALIRNAKCCRPGSLRFGCDGEGDMATGWAVAHRVGYADPDRREFSVKDARTAGLWGKDGPWRTYPRRMLAWRALGLLARDVYSDVLGGFALAEEAEDYEPIEHSSPATRAAAGTIQAPAHDPLLDAVAAPVAETASLPVTGSTPISVRCRRHKDVDLGEAPEPTTCWKCEAERTERNEMPE